MCCEECSSYERCEEGNRLRDDCCPKCLDYYDCVGADDRGKDSYTEDSDGDYF